MPRLNLKQAWEEFWFGESELYTRARHAALARAHQMREEQPIAMPYNHPTMEKIRSESGRAGQATGAKIPVDPESELRRLLLEGSGEQAKAQVEAIVGGSVGSDPKQGD